MNETRKLAEKMLSNPDPKTIALLTRLLVTSCEAGMILGNAPTSSPEGACNREIFDVLNALGFDFTASELDYMQKHVRA